MPDWPVGWERTRSPQRARFDSNLTFPAALRELQYEVERLGASDLRIDHDRIRRGKTTRSSWAGQPADPGVVVHFRLPGGRPVVFACDAWDRTEHNVRSITRTLEAKRGIERWGCATASREYEGYAALPPGDGAFIVAPASMDEDPAEVLGVAPGAPASVVRAAWKARMMEAHPDRPGGSEAAVHRITKARDQLLHDIEVVS